jgi:anti-sigma regulatory factor (Ser/Thr protein kinase)
MFSFQRLSGLINDHPGGGDLIPHLLAELDSFTGPGWEQEDDVTMLTLQRKAAQTDTVEAPAFSAEDADGDGWRLLAEFEVASAPGNERSAMHRVADITADLSLSEQRRARLKTAVAEATMNAMEHGNRYDADLPVHIAVHENSQLLRVRIVDRGGERAIASAETPDIDAKLAGLQSPRGWGLFLIQNMVDEMKVDTDGEHHIVELYVTLEEADR